MAHSYSSILVGTDGSSTASTAVTRAITLAAKLSARLIVVSAYETGGHSVAGPLESAAEDARAAGIAEVSTFARPGDPADALLDVAEEEGADLIVVGNQGMTGARRLLGSVPNKVSHHAPSSVLVIRTNEALATSVDASFHSILVGTDGSGTAKKAIEHAFELASELGAKLTVVCAFEHHLSAAGSQQGNAAGNSQDAAERVLSGVINQAAAAGLENVETFAREGDPAGAIIDVAAEQGADLIIVGNQGMTGGRRRVVGSVPNQVSHHAPCSVLVVQTS